MPRAKANNRFSKGAQKRGNSSQPLAQSNPGSKKAFIKGSAVVKGSAVTVGSAVIKGSAVAEGSAVIKGSASYKVNSNVTKKVTATIVRRPASSGSNSDKQGRIVVISNATTESKQPYSLSAIADKLQDRELFPEKIKRAKTLLNNF